MKFLIITALLLFGSSAYSQDYQAEFKEMYEEAIKGELLHLSVNNDKVYNDLVLKFRKTGIQFIEQTSLETPLKSYFYLYSNISEVKAEYNVQSGRLTSLWITTINNTQTPK